LAVSEKPGARAPSELLQEIATELCDAESILRAVKAQKTCSAQRIVTAQDKPQTPVEETVAEVWGEVLRMEEIPIHDHFFNQLGGDSLLGTQIISRLRQLFGLHLPLRALFEAPTVASLSMVILQDMAQDGQRSEVTGILAELESSDQPVPEGGDKILL
jgi:acyl carrier protein